MKPGFEPAQLLQAFGGFEGRDGQLGELLQHGGLADNVIDHRLNSRTVYMNPVSRFIYWNMNYHVEHHMFPMVPYHALPRLHEIIKHDLPKPNNSIPEAFREMWPAIRKQLQYEDYFLKRYNARLTHKDQFVLIHKK